MKKIVIIGPESTGKSSLCAALAAHYQSAWVKEYAREYLLKHGTDYSFEDLLDIAKGQIKLEEDSKENPGPALFLDTNMYVMKVWCEFVFDKCHHWILNRIVERKYDGYLLCNIDLPWQKDELREYPDYVSREKLFHYYKDCMLNQELPWKVISGEGEERIKNAVSAIDKMLKL